MPIHKTSITPEQILLDHSPTIRAIAERLRTLIHAIVPEAVEKAYPSWHGIGYSHPQAGYFCAIFPQQDLVRLGFEWGVLLADTYSIFSGTGSQVRYVDLRSEKEIPEDAIRELIQAAIALPGDRKMKLWLVQNKARPQD